MKIEENSESDSQQETDGAVKSESSNDSSKGWLQTQGRRKPQSPVHQL